MPKEIPSESGTPFNQTNNKPLDEQSDKYVGKTGGVANLSELPVADGTDEATANQVVKGNDPRLGKANTLPDGASGTDDVNISSPQAGDVLRFNGTSWENAQPSTTGIALNSVATTGGDLTLTQTSNITQTILSGTLTSDLNITLPTTGSRLKHYVSTFNLVLDGFKVNFVGVSESQNILSRYNFPFAYDDPDWKRLA